MTIRRLALAATAAALLTSASPAAAATVTGGRLEWTMANHYPLTPDGAEPDTLRTALGYVLASGPSGTATPTAPATLADANGTSLPALSAASPAGLERRYTLGFPHALGELTAGKGSIELRGAYTFTTTDVALTFIDPLVTLDGTTGTIKASGTRGGPAAGFLYDRSVTQFDLDLSRATVLTGVDGTKVIDGIVPVGTTDTFLSFGPGARAYGTMRLTLQVAEEPVPPTVVYVPGPPGPAGPPAPAARAVLRTIALRTAPFAGNGEHKVKVLDRTTRMILASGTVKRRTLRIAYFESNKLQGAYALRLTNGTLRGRREATITIR